MVRWPVFDRPGPVQREDHRQLRQHHVVIDAVERPLHEGRIDRADRPQAADRQPGGIGHRMLFGDADVMKTVPVRFRERSEPRAVFHGRRDRVDFGVARGQLDRRFAEHA